MSAMGCVRLGLLTAGVSMSVAASALGQTALPLLNPSFELSGFTVGGVLGFTNNADPEARVRSNGDGLVPAVIARTGNRCIEIGARANGNFASYTTDVRNFFAPGFPFYDVAFDYNGGDIKVTAWYMIPASHAIVDSPAALKLEAKGAGNGNQNNARRDPWIIGDGFESELIRGHTNGQWRQLVIVWPIADIRARTEADALADGYTLPPNPNRIKITFGRWNYDAAGEGDSVIFWDDLTFEQLPATPTCMVDFNDDGFLNQEDLGGFLTAFLDESVPPGPSGTSTAPCPGEPSPYDTLGYAADFNRDCSFNQEDLGGFITEFFAQSEMPNGCVPG